MQTEEITLTNLAGGAAEERFNEALRDVLINIVDPNTEATAERTVTLTVKLKPDDSREMAATSVDVKTKLAPPKRMPSKIFIAMGPDGPHACEHHPQQVKMNFDALMPAPAE